MQLEIIQFDQLLSTPNFGSGYASARPVYMVEPGASASRGVPANVSAFADTHRKAGQVELTCVVGYIARWFAHSKTVNHSSANQARRTPIE